MECKNLEGYSLFRWFRYFKEGNSYHIYDVRDDSRKVIASFSTKSDALDYLKQLNFTHINGKSSNSCDILGCSEKGKNHIYDQSFSLIGCYCDSCFADIKGFFHNLNFKRFPVKGSLDYRDQTIVDELHNEGVEASPIKNGGIKFEFNEPSFNMGKLIGVLQRV